MVLKRKFILFFSIILFNFIGVANPFIDGIEGYKVSPITINTSEDYYLINESCNISGVKVHTCYQFNFDEENIITNASINFLGSGATGSMNEEYPIPNDLLIKINDKEIHYDVLYEGNLIKSISDGPFDKRIPGIVRFSFVTKKNTTIDIFYSNDPILLNYESQILYTFYIEKIEETTKYLITINNEDYRKIVCLFDEQIMRFPKENRFEIHYTPSNFINNTDKSIPKKYHIKIQIFTFGFDEESKFYYPKYSNNKLSKKDLFFLSDKQLRLLRNMFYAVHGYKFKDETLNKYFQNELVSDYIIKTDFSEDSFNAIENDNIENILVLENIQNPIFFSEYLK